MSRRLANADAKASRLLPTGDEAGTAPEDRAFRPDVQGMRAIAVMFVLLAHVGFPGMVNGTVGVDVFFVISGFVITGILLRERARTGGTSIIAFYGRRSRRIIPMAVFVIAVVVVIDRIVDGAVLSHDVAIDGRWDALFQGNGGYLRAWVGSSWFHDVYSGPSPPQSLAGLAVYWSLAVEEKFYVVYPLIFVAIAAIPMRWPSLRIRLTVVLVVVVAGSFAYAYNLNPFAAYVSTPARAWELAVGGLLAVGTIWLRRIPDSVAASITWVGLGGLLFVVLYQQLTFWPHELPVLPVVATVLIIAGGTAVPRFGSEVILGLKPLQWLALCSFSLYLVHKPIYVWAVQFIGRPLSLLEEVAVGVIAIGVAAACYALIENRIRHARVLTRSGPASIAMGIALIASCVILTIAVP